ncbi:hypothetical protein [Salinispora arenicola]|uniref:Cell division protein FtsB n=1 Tax=Salinispora arenicola TaxID=168697 RepID=A0A542XPK3_SALAC|nr:hypothetical protein [Salinispora arenicola]MCN0151407.1 hypothetical protein [Salinispora arenicola]TQL37787.1 hypothetical protein FB564_2956 [Salinispora arenicola]GIM86164.1 hypothetical protein Sar04_29000 [Salinispora arenicola]
MTVDKRDRRNETGGGQRAPRSGGRIAAQRATRVGRDTPRASRVGETRARGAREFPTQGTAALRPAARADSASPPRLRVAPPVPVSVPRAPFAALVVVLVVGGVLGILLINTKINENSFHLKQLQEQQVDLNLQQQQLNRQITDAKAPGNLVDAARKLGLVEVGEPGYIQLPDGGEAISVPQPAGTGQQGTGG